MHWCCHSRSVSELYSFQRRDVRNLEVKHATTMVATCADKCIRLSYWWWDCRNWQSKAMEVRHFRGSTCICLTSTSSSRIFKVFAIAYNYWNLKYVCIDVMAGFSSGPSVDFCQTTSKSSRKFEKNQRCISALLTKEYQSLRNYVHKLGPIHKLRYFLIFLKHLFRYSKDINIVPCWKWTIFAGSNLWFRIFQFLSLLFRLQFYFLRYSLKPYSLWTRYAIMYIYVMMFLTLFFFC